MAEADALKGLREQIDELDHRIVELFNARARIVVDIGKVKHQSGAPVYAPDREKMVLERIRRANKESGGPLPDSLFGGDLSGADVGEFSRWRSRCGLRIWGRRGRIRIWRA